MKRVISYLLTGVLITCGMSIGTTSNIFANQIAKESSIPFIMQPGTVLVYDDNLNPVILEGGYINDKNNVAKHNSSSENVDLSDFFQSSGRCR
jgi:antitoxin component of RelBE/YafQ-DinJ toxin-antitoxin module